MELNKDTQKKYQIISALALSDRPTIADIARVTDIAESTVKRQISLMRKEYRMDIQFVQELTGKPGKTGYYLIVDWGIINASEFLREFGGRAILSESIWE